MQDDEAWEPERAGFFGEFIRRFGPAVGAAEAGIRQELCRARRMAIVASVSEEFERTLRRLGAMALADSPPRAADADSASLAPSVGAAPTAERKVVPFRRTQTG